MCVGRRYVTKKTKLFYKNSFLVYYNKSDLSLIFFMTILYSLLNIQRYFLKKHDLTYTLSFQLNYEIVLP